MRNRSSGGYTREPPAIEASAVAAMALALAAAARLARLLRSFLLSAAFAIAPLPPPPSPIEDVLSKDSAAWGSTPDSGGCSKSSGTELLLLLSAATAAVVGSAELGTALEALCLSAGGPDAGSLCTGKSSSVGVS